MTTTRNPRNPRNPRTAPARPVAQPKLTDARMSISRRHGFVGSAPRGQKARQQMAARTYVAAFYDAVYGVLVCKRSDALDVAGFAAERLLEHNFAGKMQQYPDPAMYGRKNARNAAIDYDRRQAADRGEGARHGRGVDYLDAIDLDWTWVMVAGWEGVVATAIDVRRLLATLAPTITDRELRAYWLVKVEGRTVKSVAKQRGVRRETISRTCSKVHKALVAAANGPALEAAVA